MVAQPAYPAVMVAGTPNAVFVRQVVPSRPNWVSSTAEDEARRVEPWPLPASNDPAAMLADLIGEQPRTRIVEQTADRVRSVFVSLVFRFRDDVEFVIGQDRIDVLSASRVGHSDLGVNRRRVESLRREWVDRVAKRSPTDG